MSKRIRTAISLLICAMMLLTQFAFAIEEAEVPAGAETAKETAAESEKAAPEEVKEEPAKEEAKPAAEAPKEEAKAEEEKKEDSAKEESKAEKKEPAKEETKAEQKKEEKKDSKPSFSDEAKINGVKVSVKAAEGIFPEGAKLSVEKVSKDNQKKVDKAVDEAREDNLNVAAVYSFDVKVLDKNGKEIQPADKKKVDISFKLDEADDANLDATIYHLEDTKSGLKAEELKTKTDKDVVSAETNGFSYYTVEFTYNDLQYVMDGDSSVALADILKTVGLEGEVTDVKVSNADLFSAEKKDDKWMVTAHKAFTSKEWMKVTIGGVEYEIVVTDTVPAADVTTEVTMYGGEVKDDDFKITTGVVLGPNNAGNTATIRNCTVTNEAKNSRDGGVSDCTGSAFIAKKENNLLFDNVKINSSTKSLVLNIWANASVELKDSTLDGSGVEWGDVPFILNGAYGGVKGTLNVSGDSIIKNTKGAIDGGSGGSIINVNSGTLTLERSEIALKNNNRFVVKNGATLILDETTLDVTDCAGEPAITVEEGGTLIIRNGSSIKATAVKDFNKGIIVSSGTVEIADSEISGITKNSGDSSIIEIKSGDLTISGSTFQNNSTPNCKGGLILANNAGTVSIEDSTFKGNTSGNAPIYVGSSKALNIAGESTFSENRTKVNDTGTKGGAIWAYDTPVTIGDGVTFDNNIAYLGGAIYLQDCEGSKIGKASFKENGTKFPDDTWDNAIMTCDGGAIYMSGGSAEFNGTTLWKNVAEFSVKGASAKTVGSGGGIYMHHAKADFNGVKFRSNTALLHGGGLTVAHDSNAYIKDLNGDPTEFTENLVEYGMDQAGGGLFINFAYVNMADTAIYDNAADDAGGGISTCTKGAAQARVMNGAAIFDNKILEGTHENGTEEFYPPVEDIQNYKDIFFQTIDHKNADTGELLPDLGFPPFPYELYERMFNDGLHNWKAKPITTQNEDNVNLNSFVAQSNPTNKDVSKAKVVFTGNQAWRNPYWKETVSGGGIACNGLLEIGTATEIKIVKLWDDKPNTSARPDKDYFLKHVKILADGEEIDKDDYIIDVITENVEDYVLRNNIVDVGKDPVDFGDKVPWLIIVSGLPKYSDDAGTKPIEYSIDEKPVNNYQIIDCGGDMSTYFKVENKLEFIKIEVEKKWDDKDDDAALRPETVDVKLLADGKETGKVLTLGKDNNWKGEFTDLVKYDGDKEIQYSVEEVIEGNLQYYTVTVSGDAENGFTVTNKLEVLTETESTGTKNWVGDEEKDRPKSITIQLLENGTPLEDVILEITPDEDGEWTYRFDGMPKYKNGKEIEYSVKELNVPEGYRDEADGFNLTNTYTEEKPDTVIDLKFKKKWDDGDDADGIRPEKVTVRLMRDDEFTGDVLILKEEDNWRGAFEDLPIEDSNGKKYTYGFAEDEVRGYHLDKVESEGEYNVLVNKHDVKAKGVKTGDDTHAMNLLILLAACTAVLTAISIRRKKEQ